MTTPSGDDRESLEQLLRDERALRTQAEERAAAAVEKAAVWRGRAEARGERIERLVRERDAAPRLLRWLRRGSRGRPPVPAPEAGAMTAPPPEPVRPRSFAAVQAVVAVSDTGLRRAVGELRTVDLEDADPTAFAAADVVVVDGPGLEAVPAGARRLFDEWLASPARAPLAALDLELGTFRSVVLGSDDYRAVLDATEDRPRGATPLEPTSQERREGAILHLRGADIVGVSEARAVRAAPPPWLVAAAARGRPVFDGPWRAGDTELRQAAVRARRWAYRRYHPAEAAGRLIAAAGVAAADPRPGVAAVLVSRRPADLAAAIDRVERQTWSRVELVVGLHGVTAGSEVRRAIDRAGARMPVTVLERPADVSFGSVLNDAVAAARSPLVAKIDDDDFYGPAYLEDAIQALAYSGADVVGKGAQYAYLAAGDRTVLRRPHEEETVMGGVPTGASTVFRRAVWDAVKFPHRPRFVDSIFLTAARALGFVPYAVNRWEFCVVRRTAGHTYDAAADTLTAGSEPAFDGFHPERLVVDDFDSEASRP